MGGHSLEDGDLTLIVCQTQVQGTTTDLGKFTNNSIEVLKGTVSPQVLSQLM